MVYILGTLCGIFLIITITIAKAVGNYVLYKEHQDETLKENYEERYELG